MKLVNKLNMAHTGVMIIHCMNYRAMYGTLGMAVIATRGVIVKRNLHTKGIYIHPYWFLRKRFRFFFRNSLTLHPQSLQKPKGSNRTIMEFWQSFKRILLSNPPYCHMKSAKSAKLPPLKFPLVHI